MRRVIVARAHEIGPGERKLVEIGGRSIGVFNIGGEYFALRNRCPHQGGPLCEGFQFSPLRSAAPGDYRTGPSGEVIRCPWHGWEFEIRTGRSWFDPERTRVRSYPAAVRGAQELQDPDAPEDPRAPTAPAEPVKPGAPAVERYCARSEGRYVVVELER